MVSIDSKIKRPLCVDLDGTLLATDVLWESLLLLLKTKPLHLFSLPFWLFKGKAHLKYRLAKIVSLNFSNLPYRKEVLDYLRKEQKSGKEIILATATDHSAAESIAGHLGLFSSVIASDGKVNLTGHKKLKALENHIGNYNFDYIGNDVVDLPIWNATNRAIIVNPSRSLLSKVRRTASIHKIIIAKENKLITFFKAIRVVQWVKNILLFIPLITSHKITEIDLIGKLIIAYIVFGLCASSVYVLNDLVDLENDRLHPKKKYRPLSSGLLQIKAGFLLVPVLFGSSILLSLFFLPVLFAVAICIYFIITTAYSFYFKKILIVDVLILAGLYTFRVLLGGIAVNITISTWLLAFSMFFFLGLAFLKRYTELSNMVKLNHKYNHGRGYIAEDIELLRIIGPISGYLSVLVIVLYINSNQVAALYQDSTILWLVVPFFLYWITRIWFLSQRGKIEDEPLVFTVKDPISYFIGLVILLIIFIAAKYSIF